MKRLQFILLILFALPFLGLGQSNALVFTQDQLMFFVQKYHPVSVQANLLLEKGESTVRKGRGAFDPYLHTDLNQKFFDEKRYFSILNTGLKVPTWYGVELKTGFDQNQGAYLNPENKVAPSGLWYAGISVPLGKGLFIDKRRASLKKAKLFAESTAAARIKLLNDLYFDAIKQYWKWVDAWNQYQVFDEAVELAQTRFEGVKLSHSFGDKPAIDTLEAFILVQNRQLNRNKSYLKYQNATLDLSNFLWMEDDTPLEITDSLRPPTVSEIGFREVITLDSMDILLSRLILEHPDMELYDYKLRSLDVEERLKVEGLKPKVNLNYNAITEIVGDDYLGGLSAENYKWGISFSFPLFLREQRGDLQLTRLKIKDAELGKRQKLLELQNKLKNYHNQQLNLQNQLELYSDIVNNYYLLTEGERKKFTSGESSLFLVNSREAKLIQAKLKSIELTTMFKIGEAGLEWATGVLSL